MPNSPKSTTPPRATGKASLRSKNWQRRRKCLKMFPISGNTSRPSGRSIFLLLDTFLARTRLPTRSTRQTFFFYLMTSSLAEKKIYKYALTVIDIASRYKEAEPLTSKNSDEVATAFQSIYRRGPLTWPHMLQVDPGHELTKEMEKHKTYCRAFQSHVC